MENINDLIIKINTETSILFLGQEYEKNMYTSSLREVLQHVLHEDIFLNYVDLSYSEMMDIIIDYCEENLDKVSLIREAMLKAENSIKDVRFPLLKSMGWSGIVTSLMNQMPGFSDYRVVSNRGDIKNDYFSRRNPYITYLFGKSGSEKGGVPLTFDEKMASLAQKTEFLSRIFSRLKMSGVLVIDGWDTDRDWISSNDFSTLISFPQNSVHIFGVSERTRQNRQIKQLEKKGIANLYTRSLYDLLCIEGYGLSETLSGTYYDEDEDGIEITIDSVFDKAERSIQRLSYQILNQLDSAISILDDSILDNPDYIDREEYFLRFLSVENDLPMWGGYSSGFYFKRDIDEELIQKVLRQLSNTDPAKNRVVLLEGNNSSGKSATLGNLAYQIRLMKKYPVIYITSKMNEQEQYIELERLIKNHFNAKMGARKTAIIWDKNTYAKDDIYENMLKSLEECNVVIVGSRYITSLGNSEEKHEVVTLEDNLAIDTEMVHLRNMLQTISGVYAKNFDAVVEQINGVSSNMMRLKNRFHFKSEIDKGNWFLLILNRLFEEMHEIQKRSVGCEVQHAQNNFLEFLNSYASENFSENIFSKMYEVLGFSRPDNSEVYSKDISKIFNMLAIAGKYGLELPAMIIFRVYEDMIGNWQNFINNIERSSMIQIDLHDDGIMMVHFRRSLEAILFLEQQVNDYDELLELEVDSLLSIIKNTNFYDMDGIDSEALQVVNLIRKFGPNGPDPTKYRKYFYKIAEIINKTNDDINDEAVLVSSHLIREASYGDLANSTENGALLDARRRLRKAINKYGNSRTKSQQLVRLKVEISANLLKSISVTGQITKEEREIFKELESYLESAMEIDITKFSVGVFLDASLRVYDIEINSKEKARILSRMLQIVDDVNDMQFSSFGENIHSKVLTVLSYAQKYDEIQLEYDRLIAEGSDVGIYRRAMKELAMYSPINIPNKVERKKIEAALNILEDNINIVKTKPRSLYLYIRLLWIKMTGYPIFTEKQFVKLNDEEWERISSLCQLYINNVEAELKPFPYFILEINSFRKGCVKEFKEITEITREFKRTYSAYVTYVILCDSEGQPLEENIKIKRSSNRRMIFSAVFEKLNYDGLEAYFKDSNFKDEIDIFEGKKISSALLGFNLYGVVVYSKSDLYSQIGGKVK